MQDIQEKIGMKRCKFCGVENMQEIGYCFNCGNYIGGQNA